VWDAYIGHFTVTNAAGVAEEARHSAAAQAYRSHGTRLRLAGDAGLGDAGGGEAEDGALATPRMPGPGRQSGTTTTS
jgi:hypothetical protein